RPSVTGLTGALAEDRFPAQRIAFRPIDSREQFVPDRRIVVSLFMEGPRQVRMLFGEPGINGSVRSLQSRGVRCHLVDRERLSRLSHKQVQYMPAQRSFLGLLFEAVQQAKQR